MATKNIKVIGSNKAKDDIAGPGHNPTKPQPIPNREEPRRSFLFISFFFGKLISKPSTVLFLFCNK